MKHYKKRDVYELDCNDLACNDYTEHVSAMTGESLHSKSDIAAELAIRDIHINILTKWLAASSGWNEDQFKLKLPQFELGE